MAHLPRLYVPGHIAPGPLRLDSAQAKRLAAVTPLREGDPFLVFSGDGREWRASAGISGPAGMTAKVGELTRQEPAPDLVVEVWCALGRPNRFDWTIETCVEAGADLIRPLVGDRAARGSADSAPRLERWTRIAIEAAEHAGRLFVPVIEAPERFAALLDRQRHALLLASQDGREWSQTLPLLPRHGQVTVAIGPDAGFSEADRALALRKGALLMRLGPHVLRPETAALAATVLLRAH